MEFHIVEIINLNRNWESQLMRMGIKSANLGEEEVEDLFAWQTNCQLKLAPHFLLWEWICPESYYSPPPPNGHLLSAAPQTTTRTARAYWMAECTQSSTCPISRWQLAEWSFPFWRIWRPLSYYHLLTLLMSSRMRRLIRPETY